MTEKQRTEMSAELLEAVRRVAEEQGRSETEVLEEAVVGYLAFLAARRELRGVWWGFGGFGGSEPSSDKADSGGIGRILDSIHVGPRASSQGSLAELFSSVDRWQRERGIEPLPDEEAIRLADEELHAMRRERRAGR